MRVRRLSFSQRSPEIVPVVDSPPFLGVGQVFKLFPVTGFMFIMSKMKILYGPLLLLLINNTKSRASKSKQIQWGLIIMMIDNTYIGPNGSKYFIHINSSYLPKNLVKEGTIIIPIYT